MNSFSSKIVNRFWHKLAIVRWLIPVDDDVIPVLINLPLLRLLIKYIHFIIFSQFHARLWLFIDQKVIKVLCLNTSFLAHINTFRTPLSTLEIVAAPFAMWFALSVIAELRLTVESVNYAAIALWSTFVYITFGHA